MADTQRDALRPAGRKPRNRRTRPWEVPRTPVPLAYRSTWRTARSTRTARSQDLRRDWGNPRMIEVHCVVSVAWLKPLGSSRHILLKSFCINSCVGLPAHTFCGIAPPIGGCSPRFHLQWCHGQEWRVLRQMPNAHSQGLHLLLPVWSSMHSTHA